tara:strand:+ start:3152 stop:4303 length:1152 start_codon:yes stop_codon:yes gene_type:complete
MNDLSDHFFQKLIKFRQELHQHPEVSNLEKETAQRVIDFVTPFHPDELVTEVGGHGVLVNFKGKNDGETTAIRAELDALPILEANHHLDYRSKVEGNAHLCGHDGHMAMVLSLVEFLSNNRPKYGHVILLFQPSEETGEGAARMLNDKKFLHYSPDEIIGLHNIPEEPMGKVLISNSHFAAASKGLKLYFTGSTSHAAEPQKGKNPAFAIAELIQFIQTLKVSSETSTYAIATIVHVKVGEVAFGISPADGVIMLTLRSFEDAALEELEKKITSFSKKLADSYQLEIRQEETEVFPATNNHKEQTEKLTQVVDQLGLERTIINQPFKWSEDFGHFLKKTKGTFFGLGSGIHQPVLHHKEFNFPDELIPIGYSIYKNYIQLNHY